jgi:F0F1-type ATP synthase gamma subunit
VRKKEDKNMEEKMATEEYLEKMKSLEENSLRIEKKEILEKESLPFTRLGAYIHLLPIVIELLEVIDKSEKNKHAKLWWMLYEVSANSITDLIVGYNKYHTQDKANLYNKARENISRMQALIIILTSLKQFEKESEEKYCMKLEECIRASSSLIRTIEGKGR